MPGDDAAPAHGGDDLVEFRDAAAARRRESVMMLVPRSARRLIRAIITSIGDGLREIVVFVAIGAGQIAAPDRDDVGHDGMVRPQRSAYHKPPLAQPPVKTLRSAT